MAAQFANADYQPEEIPSHKHVSKAEENVKPLLFWKVLPVAEQPQMEDDHSNVFVYHLCLKYKKRARDVSEDVSEGVSEDVSEDVSEGVSEDVSEDVTPEHLLWSLPLRLSANKEGVRSTLAVPEVSGGQVRGQPFCVTSSTDNGVTYLVISKDLAPQCWLHNQCNFPVLFGQALMNISLSGEHVKLNSNKLHKNKVKKDNKSIFLKKN